MSTVLKVAQNTCTECAAISANGFWNNAHTLVNHADFSNVIFEACTMCINKKKKNFWRMSPSFLAKTGSRASVFVPDNGNRSRSCSVIVGQFCIRYWICFISKRPWNLKPSGLYCAWKFFWFMTRHKIWRSWRKNNELFVFNESNFRTKNRCFFLLFWEHPHAHLMIFNIV